MKIHSNLAFAKNISLSSTIAQETHVLQGDEVRLAQVVASLLYKAIECTPHGGTVHIELSLAMKEARPHVQMAIRHNGFGLTEEDLSRLSGQFKKGEFRYLGPLALEFAAIQKLVHLHGGTLETQSKWAEWTAFIVTMPQGAISRLESLQS
jgi:signal transduction histidine kinase